MKTRKISSYYAEIQLLAKKCNVMNSKLIWNWWTFHVFSNSTFFNIMRSLRITNSSENAPGNVVHYSNALNHKLFYQIHKPNIDETLKIFGLNFAHKCYQFPLIAFRIWQHQIECWTKTKEDSDILIFFLFWKTVYL
jgi:hypothetical protein